MKEMTREEITQEVEEVIRLHEPYKEDAWVLLECWRKRDEENRSYIIHSPIDPPGYLDEWIIDMRIRGGSSVDYENVTVAQGCFPAFSTAVILAYLKATKPPAQATDG